MMKEIVKKLRCPISNNRLHELNEQEVRDINDKIKNKELVSYEIGTSIEIILEEALVDESGKYYYPIIDGIFFLLKDHAIVGKDSVMDSETSAVEKIKMENRSFYDDKGWEDVDGDFEDAVLFEDLRDISKNYINKCHDRFGEIINQGGEFIVDVASGPIQYDKYIEYHKNFDKRVCVDFSISALKQAKKKIGDKGIYVLGDITNMPFLDNSMDSVISLHTVYHVPKKEQIIAFHEINRITKQGNKSAVIYSWGNHAFFMNLFLFPRQLLRIIKVSLISILYWGRNAHKKANTSRGLYFYSYKRRHLVKQLNFNFDITVWRSVSVPFMRFYIQKFLLGKAILRCIYKLEQSFPHFMGKIGQYPVFIINKEDL